MMKKPITVARQDYMQKVVEITNNAELPAFVKIEVLERALEQLRPYVEKELKRDSATYRAACIADSREQATQVEEGVIEDG